jgi:hypothetical protein
MSTTYTPNANLAQPALGDTGWSTPMNGNTTILDGVTAIGSLAVTLTEVPSASLSVKIAAGNCVQQSGTLVTYAGISSTAMTASATNYAYLDLTASGALTVNTTGFPTTAHMRLAIVVAGSATITSITDQRVPFLVCGTYADGVNLTFGSTSGTEIGTAATQKIGFYGKTPAVQPTMGSVTASSSWTSVEQGMLQTVWNNLRALGLGS